MRQTDEKPNPWQKPWNWKNKVSCRASPRTQSVQREAMAESQVSIDGQLRQLEDLFFGIATQNPVESRGIYPLPETQMDRFALQFSLDISHLKRR